MIKYILNNTCSTLYGIMILIIQYYLLTFPRIDVNNILTDAQSNNLDTAGQYPWNNKDWV